MSVGDRSPEAKTAVSVCAAVSGHPSANDLDGDGLDDARELSLARDYFPYYSSSGHDRCQKHGVLFRARPHPADPSKVALWYVVLYQRDCGLNGHLGDDEVFGELIDPALPPPAGILALRAISHQNTLCESVTSCGTLPGYRPCATAKKDGKDYPVVFSSLDKHGTYVDERVCSWSFICDARGCPLSSRPDSPEFANAGEPGFPLTQNLSLHGFITHENGWNDLQLFDFNPWSGARFGKAGDVRDDLEDDAFLISLTPS